jgi:2-C-methyl-D-erythritol 4-phosphate cytidylyltransferase
MIRRAMVVVAGGSGRRMASSIPKQFLDLSGKSIVFNTLSSFAAFDPEMRLVVVLPEAELVRKKDLEHIATDMVFTAGGETRFHSVKNGLAHCLDAEYIGIHDGVRPFVSHATVQKTFDAAEAYGSGVPFLPVKQSLRWVEEGGNRALNRAQVVSIQTPQTFKSELLFEAFEQDYQEHFTDDANVVESYGHSIHLIEGNAENIKITTPLDLVLARDLIEKGWKE